jgi:tRNA nucleotidyltransferase (CCA-adding enzyme)
MKLPEELTRLLREVPSLSRAYLVGGCVRDSLLGIGHKDFDLEVYGVDYEKLERELSAHGPVDLVGKSFGVIKFTSQSGGQWDFSLPRRDSKTSAGHKGFQVEFEPGIDLQVAAGRRDFTMNALMFDPRRGEYLDFFGGRDDLRKRVLRHTSSAFVEDPLRVLRGMQFAARFDLSPAPETVELCRSIAHTFPELTSWAVACGMPCWALLTRILISKCTVWVTKFWRGP